MSSHGDDAKAKEPDKDNKKKHSIKCHQDALKDAAEDFGKMGTGSFTNEEDENVKTEDNGDMVFSISRYAKESMKMMFMMRSHHMLTDVVLEVKGELFHAHKIVLSAGSSYFKAMFTSGLKESEMSRVRIQGVCPTAMGHILYFLYSGTIRVTELTVCQLLPAATMLQVIKVIDACCTFLERQLDPTNAIGIASFAEQHGCAKLRQHANQFIERHFTQICLEEEFLQLSAIQLIHLIRKDELNVQEEREVYDAVLKWVKYDEDARYPKMEHILYAVRCQFLTPNFLKEQMRNCALIKKVPACREYLERIFKELTLHKRCGVRERKPNTTRMIFIAGGYYRHSLDILEAFNVDDQKWTQLPPLRVPRSGLGAAFLKGKFYAVGGRNNSPGSSYDSDWVDRYNPVTEEWRPCAPMSLPRNRVGVAVMDELLYAVGGSAGSEYHDSVEHYEPEKDQWTMVRSMHYRRLGVGIAVVDRLMYAIGGFDGKDRLQTCECYHPENNEWTIIPPMVTGRSGAGVAALNQYIYVVGGFDGTRQLASVERYDTEHGVWDSVAPISIARSALSVTSLDGKLYAMGGFDGFNFLAIVEVYNPELNIWEKGIELATGRSGHASAVIYKPSTIPAYMMDCRENDDQDKKEENKTNFEKQSIVPSTSLTAAPCECNGMHSVNGSRCNICNNNPDAINTDSFASTRAVLPLSTSEPSLDRSFVEPSPPIRNSVIQSTGPTLENFPHRTLPFSSILALDQSNSLSLNDKKRVRVPSFTSNDVIPPKFPTPRIDHSGEQIDRDDPRKFRRFYNCNSSSLPLNEGACSSSGEGRISTSPSGDEAIKSIPFTVPSSSLLSYPSTSTFSGACALFKDHSKDHCSVKALKNNLQRRLRALVTGTRRDTESTKAITEPSTGSTQSSSSQDEDMDISPESPPKTTKED